MARATPNKLFAQRLSALFAATPEATDSSVADAVSIPADRVSRQYIGKLRSGSDVVAPSLAFTARLAQHFGVPIDYFVDAESVIDTELVLDLLRPEKRLATRQLRRLLRVAAILDDNEIESLIADASRRAALHLGTIDLTNNDIDIPEDVRAAVPRPRR